MSKLKLLVMGVDGASAAVLYRLIDEGRLPNFARLKAQSCWGALQSTFPPHTAPGWASMFTGVSPGEHGIYQFWSTKAADYKAKGVSAGDYAREPCWLTLERHGLKVGTFNIPMTHPPVDLAGGYMISWPLSKTLRYTSPASLMSELAVAGLHFHSDVVTMYRAQEDYCQQAEKFIRGRAETCLYLQKTRPVDALMVVFTEVDRVSHYFWGNEEIPSEQVRQCYEQMDAALGTLLQLVDEDTLVIVASDHGFGHCRADFSVHEWLEKIGLLKTRYIPCATGAAASHDDASQTTWFDSAHRYTRVIDWSETLFYMPTPGCFGLNANLIGREAEGALDPADLDRAEARLRAAMGTLINDDGKPLFELLRASEVYQGRSLDFAPDFILMPTDFSVMPTLCLTGELWSPPSQSGVHRPDGIVLIRGGKFPGNTRIDARIEDIYATMLAHLGLPVPKSMEGSWLIDPTALPEEEDIVLPEEGARLSAVESAFMDERLREIGYL